MSTDTTTTAPKSIDVTVRAELDGWPVDIALTLPAQQVPAALARLAEYGYRPRIEAQAAPAPAPAAGRTSGPARPRATEYSGAGVPLCPVHHAEMREGRYGWFCGHKAEQGQPADKRGYCSARAD